MSPSTDRRIYCVVRYRLMTGSPVKAAGVWFVVAGVLTSVRAGMEIGEPAYFDPVTLLDYSAAVLSSVAWAATAVALFLWWLRSPLRRGSLLVLLAAVGIAVSSVGNLLEDVIEVEFGEVLFSLGGMTGAVATLVAAVAIITADQKLRWSGVFMVLLIAGSVFPDDGGQWLSGFSLLAWGWWILRFRLVSTAKPTTPVDTG